MFTSRVYCLSHSSSVTEVNESSNNLFRGFTKSSVIMITIRDDSIRETIIDYCIEIIYNFKAITLFLLFENLLPLFLLRGLVM